MPMRAKSERVYKPGANEEWRVVYWIYPQERIKNNRKQISFSCLKYGDAVAEAKAWSVIRYINHFGVLPEDLKDPPEKLAPCCSGCYPHCDRDHIRSCANCVLPPRDRYYSMLNYSKKNSRSPNEGTDTLSENLTDDNEQENDNHNYNGNRVNNNCHGSKSRHCNSGTINGPSNYSNNYHNNTSNNSSSSADYNYSDPHNNNSNVSIDNNKSSADYNNNNNNTNNNNNSTAAVSGDNREGIRTRQRSGANGSVNYSVLANSSDYSTTEEEKKRARKRSKEEITLTAAAYNEDDDTGLLLNYDNTKGEGQTKRRCVRSSTRQNTAEENAEVKEDKNENEEMRRDIININDSYADKSHLYFSNTFDNSAVINEEIADTLADTGRRTRASVGRTGRGRGGARGGGMFGGRTDGNFKGRGAGSAGIRGRGRQGNKGMTVIAGRGVTGEEEGATNHASDIKEKQAIEPFSLSPFFPSPSSSSSSSSSSAFPQLRVRKMPQRYLNYATLEEIEDEEENRTTKLLASKNKDSQSSDSITRADLPSPFLPSSSAPHAINKTDNDNKNNQNLQEKEKEDIQGDTRILAEKQDEANKNKLRNDSNNITKGKVTSCPGSKIRLSLPSLSLPAAAHEVAKYPYQNKFALADNGTNLKENSAEVPVKFEKSEAAEKRLETEVNTMAGSTSKRARHNGNHVSNKRSSLRSDSKTYFNKKDQAKGSRSLDNNNNNAYSNNTTTTTTTLNNNNTNTNNNGGDAINAPSLFSTRHFSSSLYSQLLPLLPSSSSAAFLESAATDFYPPSQDLASLICPPSIPSSNSKETLGYPPDRSGTPACADDAKLIASADNSSSTAKNLTFTLKNRDKTSTKNKKGKRIKTEKKEQRKEEKNGEEEEQADGEMSEEDNPPNPSVYTYFAHEMLKDIYKDLSPLFPTSSSSEKTASKEKVEFPSSSTSSSSSSFASNDFLGKGKRSTKPCAARETRRGRAQEKCTRFSMRLRCAGVLEQDDEFLIDPFGWGTGERGKTPDAGEKKSSGHISQNASNQNVQNAGWEAEKAPEQQTEERNLEGLSWDSSSIYRSSSENSLADLQEYLLWEAPPAPLDSANPLVCPTESSSEGFPPLPMDEVTEYNSNDNMSNNYVSNTEGYNGTTVSQTSSLFSSSSGPLAATSPSCSSQGSTTFLLSPSLCYTDSTLDNSNVLEDAFSSSSFSSQSSLALYESTDNCASEGLSPPLFVSPVSAVFSHPLFSSHSLPSPDSLLQLCSSLGATTLDESTSAAFPSPDASCTETNTESTSFMKEKEDKHSKMRFTTQGCDPLKESEKGSNDNSNNNSSSDDDHHDGSSNNNNNNNSSRKFQRTNDFSSNSIHCGSAANGAHSSENGILHFLPTSFSALFHPSAASMNPLCQFAA